MGNYKRVIKYLGIFGGAQGVSVLLSMVRNKCASVLLGTGGFGIIALYNRTVQLFCDTTGLSLSLSAVRRLSEAYSNGDENEVKKCIKVVRSIALLTGIIGMLLMMLMYIATFFEHLRFFASFQDGFPYGLLFCTFLRLLLPDN